LGRTIDYKEERVRGPIWSRCSWHETHRDPFTAVTPDTHLMLH